MWQETIPLSLAMSEYLKGLGKFSHHNKTVGLTRLWNRTLFYFCLFSGNTARRLDPITLEPVQTVSISSLFPGFPSNAQVDAAVTFKGPWPVARSYLITGSQYYRWENSFTLICTFIVTMRLSVSLANFAAYI